MDQYDESAPPHGPDGDRLLEAIGGEAGCYRLSAGFYSRVGKDPVLRPLFPGKSLRCATEEFAAFLIQFLGGDEEQTQKRWWLSLRESHARFRISQAERSAWLKHMSAALGAAGLDQAVCASLRRFFESSSSYIAGNPEPVGAAGPDHPELAGRWRQQLTLDDTVGAIVVGRDRDAISLARTFISRPSVFVGLLARMVQSGRRELVLFATGTVDREPQLGSRRFAGRTLLHFASGSGCVSMVESLLRLGADPNVADAMGHAPLYRAANECASETDGPAVVRMLVGAGANVVANGGVTRATALHMAARRGHAGIAQALLDCGAAAGARDAKGDTPLQRAINCRRHDVAQLLRERAGQG